jgi:DNA-binding beta-propeller fold protein YncE
LSIVALGLALLTGASQAAPVVRSDDPTPAASDRWLVIAGGPSSSVALEQPSGVAVDPLGRVWITDARRDRLFALDPQGALIGEWVGPGQAMGQFHTPNGVAVDVEGSVYVADTGNNRVQKLSSAGDPVTQWGAPGVIPDLQRNPVAVAVDQDQFVYVALAGGRFGLRHRIDKLNQRGEILQQWGPGPDFPWGNQPGWFTSPYGVAVDAAGSIYVADTGNHRVQKLGTDGEVQAIWGSQGAAPGQFDRPTGVALDGDGNLYVVDSDHHRIQVLSPSGEPLEIVGSRGADLGQLEKPWSVALGPDGALYVADTGNHRVQVRSPISIAAR